MRVLTAAFVAPALLAQLTTAKTVTTTTTHTHHAVKLTAAQVDAELHARQAHATAYSNGVSVNTTIVGAWRQCAAKSWVAPCTTGTVCVARSDLYSECIPNEYVERRADGRWVFKHGEPIVEVEVDVDYVVSEAGEWEQCLWEDRRLACAPGLQCVETHPWFGQCVTLEAGVGEQCAGPHWKAKCVAGSSCVKRDELYSECVANEHHVHNREHVVRHWVEDEDVVVHHHRREGRAAQWEQCKWEHDEIECAPGLQCAVQSKFFGQCVKRDALLWEQCGGLNWIASCELGSTCVKRDDVYSQCVPVAAEEYVNHEHHHHHHHHHHNHHVHHHEAPKPKPPVIEIAKEWEQCKWDDKLIDCAAGLQCAIRNDWFGQCVRTAAVAWEQCGGSFWTATCSAGNTCVKRDEHYSQCVPNDRLDHHLHHKREHIVHTTEHVHRRHPKIVETVAFWEQCAGIDWSSTCAAGSTCVKRDTRFGQCIPYDHLATHRHFSWHGDHTHWVDDEPEVVVVVESEVQLWDQCLWRGRQLECAAGLQCAAQSEWFGQCVPTVAAIGEQCGGQFWTAVCAAGSKCVERDALYSHCVPVTHHHHHHRRADEFVVHREPVAARVAVAKEFEQCKWEDARVDCAAGLRCVVHNQWFGQCVRAVAAAGEQCSGLHWTAPCAAGSTCVQRDEHFGECVPTATTTRHAPHHHHEEVRHYHDSHHHVDHHHDHRRHGHWVYEVEVDAVPVVHTRAKAGEFEQCKWENDEVECAAGLQCAVESDWFGQCVKREAELWGQCGGRHWLAACPIGSKCVHRRDDFKQCLPVA